MAACSPLSPTELPILLFCDTFSHQENEEMHLDLISFPRPVAVTEARVIPAGHRVHAAISEREKVGETHPQSFKLDMFIRNLDNAGAVVFERLGLLDYKEPNNFQVIAEIKAATDVVVLRGWYNKITISLYGYFTDVNRASPAEPRQEPRLDRPSVIMDPRPNERPPDVRPDRDMMEKVPERAERGPVRGYHKTHERGPIEKMPDRRERSPYERGHERPERGPRTPDGYDREDEGKGRRGFVDDSPIQGSRKGDDNVHPRGRFPEEGFRGRGRGADWMENEGRQRGRDGDAHLSRPVDSGHGKGRQREEEPSRSRRSKDRSRSPQRKPSPVARATVGETTSAKPTTPPGSPREEEEAADQSDVRSDDLFEPLTPDHSPTDLFMSDEADDDDEQDAYEEILSDEEEMSLDDGTLDEASVQFADMELYSEDAWMSVSVSFNPYQCDLSQLMSFSPPDETEHEAALQRFLKDAAAKEKMKEVGEKLIEQFELCKTLDKNIKWVEAFEEIPPLIVPGLACVIKTKEDSDVVITKLVEWSMYALDMEEAMKQPIAVNMRLLKAGLRTVNALCSCSPQIAALLINAGVQGRLHTLITTEHVSSSLKLLTFQAFDSCTDSNVGLENFLGWSSAKETEDDNGTDDGAQKSTNGYQKLVDFLLTDQTVRVMEAASILARKIHVYELLTALQNTVERIVAAYKPQEYDSEADPAPGGDGGVEKDPALLSEQDTGMESEGVPRPGGMTVSSDDIEVIAVTLDEICNILKRANELIAQPPIKAFPTTAKITGLESSTKDPYPVLFRLFATRRLLESIVVLMASPVGCHPLVYCCIRDLVFYLLQSQRGLLFLSSHPEAVNGLIRVLTQTTEADIHHSEAPPLNEFLRDGSTADLCTPQHLGLLLIYHLQTLQAVDQLRSSPLPSHSVCDIDSADTLSTLHTLYSMTFSAIGKAAVVSVLSLSKNLESLLPFVEPTGNQADDAKLKKCVSSRYASVLIFLTVKVSENVDMLSELGPRLLAITQKQEAESSLAELNHWVAPLKDLKFDASDIPNLVEYVKSSLDSINTSQRVSCGVLVALRVLRHLACPPKQDRDKTEVHQKNLKWNLKCMQLFAANGMDIFITLLQKLGESLLRPWRLGQPFSTGQPFIMICMATPLLVLLKSMLGELLDTGTYQFKDRRLMTSLMVLHTVMCSAPMTGQLSSIAQQIQGSIVDLFMTFTRPVVQSSDHEEAIKESVWSLMLRELLKYITSTPQAFLGGLVFLSELLPVPLPMHTLEELPPEDVTQAMNHRLLWSAHLNPLSSDLQEILKSLAGSACHNLQQVLRRVCSQLADLSAPTAFNIVRTLLEVLDSELSKTSAQEKTPCSADAVRIMTLLAYLSSQPAIKISLLQLLRTSLVAKNDDLLFPSLLPAMLSQLKLEPDAAHVVSRAQYCIVSIIQNLCDPTVSLTSFVTPFTNQHLSNTLPDCEMLSVICTALLDHVGSSQQSFATILLALRSMVTLTEHNYGVYHLKRALESNTEVFYRLLRRLSSSFETGIPGPDSLSTLSTTTELLQLLLPDDATHGTIAGDLMASDAPTTSKSVDPAPTDNSIPGPEGDPSATTNESTKESTLKATAPGGTADASSVEAPALSDKAATVSGDAPTKPDDAPAPSDKATFETDRAAVDEDKSSTGNADSVISVPRAASSSDKASVASDELHLTTEISVSSSQMKRFLKADSPDEYPLKTLEKRLEESCKEDETLESLLEGITSLIHILDKADESAKEQDEDKQPDLPSSQSFQQLFTGRVSFVISDMDDGQVSPTLWFSTPPPEDIEPEADMVKSDLDSLREKYCPEFDLKAELEKGLVPSPPGSPSRKKGRVAKRKFDPLISGFPRDIKRMRGHPGRGGRGMRGMNRGRGRGMNDLFRSRKQNTSRPPSMHVDDFMAMEQHHHHAPDKQQDSGVPGGRSRGGMKGSMAGRSPMDRGASGFMGNQGRWTGPFTGQRKGPGLQGTPGGRGGAQDWAGQRQTIGGFPGQRGFQRGPDWTSPQGAQQYRGGRGMRDNQYNRPQQARGYWEAPRTKDSDNRFMSPPVNVSNYRPGAGRGYQGRHMRSFTR
ncbi:protein virilizer homolog isoform X2 [Nematostella vectensis]|uniref:protein virilizer homolog isoform X2 n=1 Tax=Nematostella vectensis TaxID=45351 RepID=UPI002076FE40|nr:protein virilizer homolog isoform X2 [Nematostella vectensis]